MLNGTSQFKRATFQQVFIHVWLVATSLNNTGLQYFDFPYLLFLVSQRRYVFISLKGNSFKCIFDPIPSRLLWNLPRLKHFSLVYFSVFALYWSLSTHFELLGLLPGEKKLPLDCQFAKLTLSLPFTVELLENSLCLVFPVYHFLFIP